MVSLRRIPFRVLGVPAEVHLRYLEEDPDLKPFLGTRPRNVERLLQAAPVGARRLLSPAALSASLVTYAERHGAPAPVLENARAIASGDVCAVVTGQQPGLFGGPLYTIHKAASAVRLAQAITATPGAPRAVPIFWNHTDDHDVDEVNRAFVVNANLDLQRIKLELPRTGASVRDIQVARPMEQALAALRDLMPRTDFRDWALQLLEPKQPDDTFGRILARMLFGLFGRDGLLVIEPRDLPPQAFEVLPRWCEMADEIRGVVRVSTEHLAEEGVDVTMDPTATLMFQHTGQRRVALSDGDVIPRATDLSPGALLRPLWQDACLPTIASVVGPGELSYLSVAGPLYKHLGVPAPLFVPRASMTLVEPSLKKLLTRFGWDLPDLGKGPEALAGKMAGDSGSPLEDALDDLAGTIKHRLAELTAQARKVDSQLLGALERARAKITEELVKLSSKMRNDRQNREGTGLRQVRRLCAHLRPRGRLQERVLTVTPFLVTHGEQLARDLVEAADPFALEHIVVEL
jgi:uncharacterized protein YllA (UPF0747 family)